MNMKLTGLALIAAGTMMASSAFAATAGKVDFTGVLTASTCSIASGDEDQVVNLPRMSTNALDTSGKTAGSTIFDIDVTGCSADITKVAAHFETSDMNPATRNARNIEPAATRANEVDVQLVQADGTTVIPLGSAGPLIDVTSGAAKLVYGGRYYATGAATAGQVKATVRFTLAYN